MLFPLSAKSETALRTAAGRLSTYLSRQRDMSLHGIARTLQSGRAHFEYRLAVVANSHDNLIDSLKNIDEISHCDFVSLPGKERNPRVAFLFEKDSPQFAHVARGLYEASPIFRESIIRCDEIMAPEIGVSVADLLSQGKNHESRHLDGQCRSVTSFAVQYGVALLWHSCGLEPAFTFGVGTGACLAACIAKAVELKDALLLAGKPATAGSKAPHPPEPAVAFKKPKVPWYVDDATEPWIQTALSANIALPHAQLDFLNHQVLLSMGSSYDPNWLGRGQMEPPSTTRLATLGSNGDDLESFMHAAARLYKIGCNLDLTRFYSQSRAIPVSLPTYPFERVRCWPEVEQGFVGNSSQTRLTPSVASVIKEVPETESPSTSEIPLELHPIPESASTKANSAAPTSVEESASGIAETQSIAELVMSAACAALGCPKGESLPLDVPLIELGMDSLMAMDLVDRLEKATGLTMPLKVTFGYESVADVIQMIETMHWVAEDHQDGKEQVQDEIHI
jgi:acyl transferase domain-containing protein